VRRSISHWTKDKQNNFYLFLMDGKGLKYCCVYDIIESGICPVLFFCLVYQEGSFEKS